MLISLPPDIETIAIPAAKAAGYDDVADYIAEAVRHHVAAENSAKPSFAGSTKLDYDSWRARFDAFLADRKPTNPDFDDSRESIYTDET